MAFNNKKLQSILNTHTHKRKQEKTDFEKAKEAIGMSKDMIQILEWSDREFKITIINIPRVLIVTVDNVPEQMDNVSRDMKTLRKNQKEMLEIKQQHSNRNE